ncbi:hypothetical protein WUBG_11238, partial [Wuchereria bancrofti]
SEFPSHPSQFIDFAQLSETEEDISSEGSKSETNLITNAPHLGFSDSYDFISHTNLESSPGTDMDSYTIVWRNADGELKTDDDKLHNNFSHYRECTVITKNYNEYVTHRKTHSQSPLIYECKVGGHSAMNHHLSITSKRMNLVLTASTVANSSPAGMHCKNAAKQNLI